MIYKRLEEVSEFTIGKNGTRLKNQGKDIYTPEDFENDLSSVNDMPERPECIINLMKSTAAPLSNVAKEKCITSNFLKCTFDENVLDPWYFCYLFNADRKIKHQIHMLHQSNMIGVSKLTMKNIEGIKIGLIDIEKQRLIGNIYRKMIIQKEKMLKQADEMECLTMEIIKKIEED